ncbi:MAG: tetratricopeptide repeat-containing sulfotransferase family protein [Steroidobacteraceae bacterium]
MDRDPVADQARLSAILAEARATHHEEAIAQARAALAEGLEHPLLLNLAALGLEREGRSAEAEPLLRRAVQIAPGDLGCRNALGLCLLALERAPEALQQFDAAIALDPTLAHLHANRANALRAFGAIAAAQVSYERAVGLDAAQAPALAGLSSIACQRGAYDEARTWAQKALAVAPGLREAIMSLAAAEFGERQLGRAESRLQELLLERTRLSGVERAYVEGLLGDVLDAEGRYEEAFAAYRSCNEALRCSYAGRFANACDYAEALGGWLDRTASGTPVTPSPQSARSALPRDHVFIIGFPRSGTSLLGVILEGHPQVATLVERECLVEAVLEFMRRPEDLDRLWGATPQVLEHFRAAYWRRVFDAGVDPSGKVFVDCCSLNTLKLPLIARLFPTARILFACRDPRDVVLSCFRNRLAMSAPTYELLTVEGTARYYAAVMRLLIGFTSLLSLEACLVRHEDVVKGFAREMRRVCEFLRLEWHPAMRDFALRARERDEPAPSLAQWIHSLGTEGLGLWRHYRGALEPVRAVLEPWVQRFYYDPD